MIDKEISADTFYRDSSAFHQAGIEKEGRRYKQKSHEALVSAFFAIIDRMSVSTALEIGAFKGEFSRRFLREGTGRYALAIEANPYNYEKYKPQLEAAGVVYHHAAVLDRTGPCELQLMVTDQDIHNGYIRGNNSILTSDARPDTRAISVPGTTLDELVADYVKSQTLPDPTLVTPVLWIDVEGALNLVISGGQQTISNSLAVFAEVETTRLWKEQATYADVAAQLSDLGFFPFLRDCEYEPEQFNVLFVNRTLIEDALLDEVTSQYSRELQPATH